MSTMYNRTTRVGCAVIAAALLLGLPARLSAQATADSYRADRERALQLLNDNKITAALPLLERLATANPQDEQVMFFLGFALLANSKLLKDANARRQTRIRARGALLKASELGFRHPLLASLLDTLPADGGGAEAVYSANQVADAAMRDGEAAFVQGDLSAALAAYQRALAADPKLYEAALFAGDIFFKQRQPDKAAEWYARAAAIDPNRETAYRYAASPLMEQGKLPEARAKYVEAIIAEPYNRLTWAGLQRWAEAAHVNLSHPRVEPAAPTPTPGPAQGQDTATSAPAGAGTAQQYWALYGQTRTAWGPANFAREYPNEQTYRHSLKEEAAALRAVAEAVARDRQAGKLTTLDPALANLVKLDAAGLLEAYILFARADNDISHDYAAYRQANRDKLRRYLLEYVASSRQ